MAYTVVVVVGKT